MNKPGKVTQALFIGLVVANFLLNTCRVPKAIELCKECLIFLSNKALTKQVIEYFYKTLCLVIFNAYCLINDYTKAIEYGQKALDLLHKSSERAIKSKLSLKLATLYFRQSKYHDAEAQELCEKALEISTKIGDRFGEASSYGNLGVVFQSLGENAKAKEYMEKALAIRIEIGDKDGQASSYGNLGTLYLALGEYHQAKQNLEKALAMRKEIGDVDGGGTDYGNLGTLSLCLGEFHKAKEYLERALEIKRQTGDPQGVAATYGDLGNVFQALGQYDKAKEHLHIAIEIRKEIGDRSGEASSYVNLGTVFSSLGDYNKAEECFEKALTISKEIGDKNVEASSYQNLGTVCLSLCKFRKAKELLEKSLTIRRAIGDRAGEATDYQCLGTMFKSLCDYMKAKDYLEKALAIKKEIGDRNGEATCYGILGAVVLSLGEHEKAKVYLEIGLEMKKDIGDKSGEALCYGNLGTLYYFLGEYFKAQEHLEKALGIRREIGDRNGEATDCGNLGTVFHSLGKYYEANQYHETALTIRKEIGDRGGEATDCGNLGNVFQFLGENRKAKEHFEKALVIRKEIGDRKGESSDYGNLANVFHSVGKYVKAKDYLERALEIQKEIGDSKGEATSYVNLGTVFSSLGDYDKAKHYYETALAISKELGNQSGEASCYANLGNAFQSLGEYEMAKEFYGKALLVSQGSGNREGEATCYDNLGTLFLAIGDFNKAKECHEKALVITKEICHSERETVGYGNLGFVFMSLGEHSKAKENLEKALAISTKIGNVEKQCITLCRLAWLEYMKGNIEGAFPYLLSGIHKCEELWGFLDDNDQFKIHFSERPDPPYRMLSAMFCASGNPYEALCVAELGRARALADLMSTQYSLKNQISPDPQSWVGLERIVKKERNCTCLYISYSSRNILLWVIKGSGAMYFRAVDVRENTVHQELVRNVDVFAEMFRQIGTLPTQHCEDRSLNGSEPKPTSSQEDIPTPSRIVEEDEENEDYVKPSLSVCYKMIIAPVVELLAEPEIIIVPDRSLYKVPFAALPDRSGKYLSETFRIRIVPSLTTLKLIQDSPADYHSQTGALIVGDPDVGLVRYKGKKKNISRLPCAAKEAAMIGRLLGVQPLLRQQASKQAVLERINSVSLIHFAAHGDAERGAISLSPLRHTKKIPVEEEYLLTMSDISRVQLRAKLVVLSCCHSGQGQIKVEGVVGIARAFLGSGARSVLVALWAIEDSATDKWMNSFYEHLVRGESASESLHEAMKWMRANGFSDVSQWAPFMLIGDDVTFDFGNKPTGVCQERDR